MPPINTATVLMKYFTIHNTHLNFITHMFFPFYAYSHSAWAGNLHLIFISTSHVHIKLLYHIAACGLPLPPHGPAANRVPRCRVSIWSFGSTLVFPWQPAFSGRSGVYGSSSSGSRGEQLCEREEERWHCEDWFVMKSQDWEVFSCWNLELGVWEYLTCHPCWFTYLVTDPGVTHCGERSSTRDIIWTDLILNGTHH